MSDVAGRRANQTGSSLEEFIRSLVQQAGYDPVDPHHFRVAQCLRQPIFAQQYPCGIDIYRKPRKCDFILYDAARHSELIIESKWQQASGSVDEKFPFLVETIAASGIDTLIVLDGGGYSAGAEQWLQNQAGQRHLLHVFDMAQFQIHVNNGKL